MGQLLHQLLLLDVGRGGCTDTDTDTKSLHSVYTRCVFALSLLSELAASLWKVQDRKGWHGSTGLEKHPSSFATSASGRFPLAGKPQAIDFPYGDATKQLNHLLSRDGKRTLGSSVPGQVILWNLTWTFLTEKQSLHHKPWYRASRIPFLQCSATQPSCSVQLPSAEGSTARGQAAASRL